MRKQRGFTLIELLVVVTIIALLIAILLPSLGRARDRAKIAACGTNLKQSSLAAIMYSSDWAATLPPEYERGYRDYNAEALNSGGVGSAVGSQQALYFGTGKSTDVGGPRMAAFALLLNTGMVSDGRVFFDPARSVATGDQFSVQRPGPINSLAQLFDNDVYVYHAHSSYFYQVHSDTNWSNLPVGTGVGQAPPHTGTVLPGPSATVPAAGVFIGAAYPKLSLNPPPNLMFETDMLVGTTGLVHGYGTGINGSFFDGHVEYIHVDSYKRLAAFAGNGFDGTQAAFQNRLIVFEGQAAKQK